MSDHDSVHPILCAINHLNRDLHHLGSLQKLLTTPVPFPLIQMTTTFLFFYLFTVPFALLSDNETLIDAISHCIVIFLLTYGFMGMQFVSIDFDDPFGDEANDFKYVTLCESAPATKPLLTPSTLPRQQLGLGANGL